MLSSPQRQRHPPQLVLQRGRSRDISPAAIARRASEERKLSRRTPHSSQPPSQSRPIQPFRNQHLPVSLKSSESSSASSTKAKTMSPTPHASSDNSSPFFTDKALSSRPRTSQPQPTSSSLTPQASSSRCTLQDLERHDSTMRGVDSSTRGAPFSTSASGISLSRGYVHEVYTDKDDEPLPPPSLQDQMQEAYAADNMHLARVLYLKIKGIEVTSDDDPRIAQVQDEDFVFVPGGQLVLDEESMAALREADMREKEKLKRNGIDQRNSAWKEKESVWETEMQKLRVERLRAQRLREGPSCAVQLLSSFDRVKGRSQPRNRMSYAGQVQRAFSPISALNQRHSIALTSSSLPSRPSPLRGAIPCNVPFKDVMNSLRGRLFQDEELDCPRPRSKSQMDLLVSLLHPADPCDSKSRRVCREKQASHTRNWTEVTHGSPISYIGSPESGSDSTISRTNSWASSTTSNTSFSTIAASPTNSPSFGKGRLPSIAPFIEEKEPLQITLRRSYRLRMQKRGLTPVALSDSPLAFEERRRTVRSGCSPAEDSADQHRSPAKNALILRVKKSMFSLLDLASKVQLSYVRTIQFAVPLALERAQQNPNQTAFRVKLKPEGYRACVADVQAFSPQQERVTARDLNLTSGFNILLLETEPEQCIPRPISSLPFATPSPLRPRYVPMSPEWRLRPVSNPVMLRLRAVQNILGERGVPWEGRGHSGSLGCGRERLTGVAFEGLGGSRLAFEAT